MDGYWKKRGERRKKAVWRQAEDKRETLVSSFEGAKREIEGQIEAFWTRYAKNNRVTLADAQKALSFPELKRFRDDLAGFRALSLGSMGRFSLEVENLSMQARVTRLQALEAQIGAVLERLNQEQRLPAAEIYREGYYQTLFEIERYRGFHKRFA